MLKKLFIINLIGLYSIVFAGDTKRLVLSTALTASANAAKLASEAKTNSEKFHKTAVAQPIQVPKKLSLTYTNPILDQYFPKDVSDIVFDYLNEWKVETINLGNTELIKCMVQLKDGRVAFGGMSEKIYLYDLKTKKVEILVTNQMYISKIIQLQNGDIATASLDGTIAIWDINVKKCKLKLNAHTDFINALIQLKDGRLVSGGEDKKVKVWNLQTQKTEMEFVQDGCCNGIVQLDDKTIITTNGENLIAWNLKTKEKNHINQGHTNKILSLILSVNNSFVTCSSDNTIRILDENSKRLTLKDHRNTVNDIIQLKDGKYASVSDDKKITIIDLLINKSQKIHSINSEHQAILQITDGRLIISSKPNKISILSNQAFN